MSESTKQFYIKFQIDDSPHKLMDAFIVSEDKERVELWEADKPTQTGEVADAPVNVQIFKEISQKFERSINSFQNTVPFIMQMLPFLSAITDDRSIREFARNHGDLLQNGRFETYALDIIHLGEMTRRIQRSASIRSGVANLPTMFFVGLVSAYDKFLADLIRSIFICQPELLSASERNLSFKDLMEIGSLEAARERIIQKEIETVIRQSHAEQIAWLEKKLSLPLTKNLDIWPDFIELCERRNLFTHAGGIVSEQYIKICRQHKCVIEGQAVGQTLRIDGKYYEHAVNTVLEFGVKLVQVIWRKLKPSDLNEADEKLNCFCYKLITQRKYKMAAKMLRFGLYDMKKHGAEKIRKMMVVNYANAEKLLGNVESSHNILDKEDWTASTDDYKICVAGVRDDIDTVIKLMPRVVEADLMKIEAFREWPVFECIRSDSKFVETFEREFGQKLLADREGVKPRNEALGSSQPDDAAEESAGDATIH